ncbi:hypothetical protein ACO0R3_000906 [Hanseniaspora guilliermondii]
MESIISDIPSTIYKDECSYCYQNEKNLLDEDTDKFLYFCLQCYQGFCPNDVSLHEQAAPEHTNFLKYKRKEKELQEENESKLKKVKLEINNEPSLDEKFDLEWSIVKKKSSLDDATTLLKFDDEQNSQNKNLFEWILNIFDKKSIEYQEKDQQWKLEIKSCEHTKKLEENFPQKIDFSINNENLSCNDCEINENLWVCLECGNLGCGRDQVGIKGNSHAVEHQKANKTHCLVLKLGSFSKSNQDIYCYICDEEVKVSDDFKPKFFSILSEAGISTENVATEKGLTELNVEQNLNWDFKITDKNGNDLKCMKPDKIVGSGLINLGNSCYFNAIIQTLFNDGISIEKFDIFKDTKAYDNLLKTVVYPNTNIKIQLKKLLSAIQNNPEQYPKGVKPLIIKKLSCIGNEEFSSGRQQDAMEFFTYFLNVLESKILTKDDETLNKLFKFDLVNKMQCKSCKKFKLVESPGEAFVNVPLQNELPDQNLSEKFFDIFKESDIGFKCPQCDKSMSSKLEFRTFPDSLVVNPTRIKLENWVPVKTCSKLLVPETIDVSSLQFEEIDQKDMINEAPQKFEPDELLIDHMIGFGGFSRCACIRALKATNNNPDIQESLNWIYDHIEDPDLNEPLCEEEAVGERVDMEKLNMMKGMGLSEKLSIKGLKLNNGNIEHAINWVFNNLDDDGELEPETKSNKLTHGNKFTNEDKIYELQSIVCHKGNSVHSGHYVVFIKKKIANETTWVLYNDEKIIKLDEIVPNKIEDIQVNGYIYIYKKI